MVKFGHLASRVRDKLKGRPYRHPVPQSSPPPNIVDLVAKDPSRWKRALKAGLRGPEVLIATSVGGHPAIRELDMALAIGLTLRGAKVTMLLCDEFLPACEYCAFHMFHSPAEYAERGPWDHCGLCYGRGRAAYDALGLPVLKYSSFVSGAQRSEARALASTIPVRDIPSFRWQDLAIGEHAHAGALRFFARGELSKTSEADTIARNYLEAALLTAMAMQKLLSRRSWRAASFHHGIYVPQGIVGEVARSLGIRITNWVVAYRKQRFIFSHGDTYHHTLLDEPVSSWENIPWTAANREEAVAYLQSRWQGSQDWIYFHDNPSEDIAALRSEWGLQEGRPAVLLLTNVIWDAQLHYRANAFGSMMEWIIATIEYFHTRPDLDLIIRIHPAEIRGGIPSRQLAGDEIASRFPTLPANIKVVGPDRDVSTYALAQQCDCALIYGTKTGVELTSMGIPVIVAGEAWIRGKGLTLDADSPEAYEKLLDNLPLRQRLDAEVREQALKYAYHFFFRRMIPVTSIAPTDNKHEPFKVRSDSLDIFSKENDPGLETICQGILNGSPFIYPAERLHEAAISDN